jgi:2-amino-4-hydroxy-6-hydroxymethyldihydropteridine diphosphokinase
MNAVAALETTLEPETLLDALQHIEQREGRERKAERWGPRTLDLDLLLFGTDIIDTPRLMVPHYGLKVREFVVLPLYEIAPELILPCQTPLKQLADNIDPNGLICYQSPEIWLPKWPIEPSAATS